MTKQGIFEEVEGLYKIIPMRPFRKTPGVTFDLVPLDMFPHIDSMDRVIHTTGAISPGPVCDVEYPWYMHEYQEDNLIVLHGRRYTDLYTPQHGRIEKFEISAHEIKKNGRVIYEGSAILAWPCGVFHRIRSDEKTGSASINLAVHHNGFDLNTNFSIYDVDTEKGTHKVIRDGHLDQF